jgi:hypothetical protein
VWQLFRQPDAEADGFEFVLYSDSVPLLAPGEPHAVGPLTVWSTGPDAGLGFGARLVLRAWPASPVDDPGASEAFTDGGEAQLLAVMQKSAQWWLGEAVDEEVAALLSLGMGIRMRSGGITRRFAAGGDPAGAPEWHNHLVPVLPAVPDHLVQIHFIRGIETPFDWAWKLVQEVPRVSATEAFVLVRAAIQYAEALWVVDSDPQLAWLRLVTALEGVAVHVQAEANLLPNLIRKQFQHTADAVQGADGEIPPKVLSEFDKLLGAGARFTEFTARFAPGAFEPRPPVEFQVDFDNLGPRLKKIYDLRSKLLHEGRPFPPMLVMGIPERFDNGAWAEHPGDSVHLTGSAGWSPQDLPMHLWVFAHIAQSAILNWWRSVPKSDPT